jgi:hypothetical protein
MGLLTPTPQLEAAFSHCICLVSKEGHPTWDSILVYGLGWAVTLPDLELALFVNKKQNVTSFLEMLKLPSNIPERVIERVCVFVPGHAYTLCLLAVALWVSNLRES